MVFSVNVEDYEKQKVKKNKNNNLKKLLIFKCFSYEAKLKFK